MSSAAPSHDAIAAPTKKKNKKAKKPKKLTDSNAKEDDGGAAEQQASPGTRDGNNHDLSAGDDEPDTPVVSKQSPVTT